MSEGSSGMRLFTVPDANGWMRECVHSDAYKQDLGDALVQAWQRGKTT